MKERREQVDTYSSSLASGEALLRGSHPLPQRVPGGEELQGSEQQTAAPAPCMGCLPFPVPLPRSLTPASWCHPSSKPLTLIP